MTRPLACVLVANRGEIACRVFRTAKRLGLRTVAVFSEADRDALHVRMADAAVPIGPAPAAESYLDAGRIIAAALAAGADCVHPGYGFLSENAAFAEACTAAGLTFIGPPAAAIRAMGAKDAAKALAERAGVPVVPGYHGGSQDPNLLAGEAERIGYPVLVKAVAGGGGRGMRRADHPDGFAAALAAAGREALAAFGDPRVLVEKLIAAPRHIEVQVFADAHGGAVHLFERDCSLQRRHQKVVEEAPAPSLPPEMREAMGGAALALARAIGYVGAGTVEFIADAGGGFWADRFYFMEMNTRLQVEHPVTEAITDLDLVELQFRVAAGEPVPVTQAQVEARGHAVEARLYAEEPAADFRPSTGRLWALRLPEGEGIRVETGLREGDRITPFYDPLIAKVIAHGATRAQALDRLGAALGRTELAGPRTNLGLLRALLGTDEVRAGRFDTGLVERDLRRLTAESTEPDPEAIRLGALALLARERARLAGPDRGSPWGLADAFQLGPARSQGWPLLVDGGRVEAVLRWHGDRPEVEPGAGPAGAASSGEARIVDTDRGVIVLREGRQTRVEFPDPFSADLDPATGGGAVAAPMAGRLTALFVAVGDRVERGQVLAVMEAMKMEHALAAPRSGVVAEVAAEPGASVAEGARLITLADEEQIHE